MNIKLLFVSVLIGLFLSGCTVKTMTLKQKEIQNRFDFKGILAEINLNEKAKTLTLSSKFF